MDLPLPDEPVFAEGQCALADALVRDGRPEEAARRYRRAIAMHPGYAGAFAHFGPLAHAAGRLGEAAALLRRAACLAPDEPRWLYNLGLVLREMGRLDEAVAVLSEAAARAPDLGEVHAHLGDLHLMRGEWEAAASAYAETCRRHPGNIDALVNLGIARVRQNRPEDAAAIFSEALRREPGSAKARINLGTALFNAGRLAESGAILEPLAGVMPEARWNLASNRLLAGDYAAGWEDYEVRWLLPGLPLDARTFNRPRWQGEPGNGRTILLFAEQGLGDTVQFCRYAPAVAARGWRVTLEVQPPLAALLAASFAGVAVTARSGQVPPHDAQCPLMSLPRLFGTRLETVPAATPYLRADPQRVARARARLGGGGLTVGLVWAGSPTQANDQNRSIPLAALRPLLGVPGVRFFSLQKVSRPGDAAFLADHPAVTDLAPGLGDFADTAAYLQALDLLITVDTSVAHVAGALGRPVWVLLPQVPDWRWLLERDDSPWYPTARLFRQPRRGDWEGVVRRLADALAARRDAGV